MQTKNNIFQASAARRILVIISFGIFMRMTVRKDLQDLSFREQKSLRKLNTEDIYQMQIV